eukprot:CAMPEP_0198260020 /NCGR_PEP_ID=MMETSP1447-20131203/9066_1 /TAXON_ID=420782 /ORGANISM="Chaetoceros dichaeta, Strain CCMP1751" /LENGTH=417 /DNA_ID=CAMNT_0043947563 /DNA_START=75 /DNA_END=1328 /DNA_ORIENTATION=-
MESRASRAHHENISASEQQTLLWEGVGAHNKIKGCPAHKDREWPTYAALMTDVAKSDYTHVLECPHDTVDKARIAPAEDTISKRSIFKKKETKIPSFCKSLCAHGVVCLAKMELFPNPPDNNDVAPYTGLLEPGQTVEHCLLRLSSAAKPPAKEMDSVMGRLVLGAVGGKLADAKLFPTAALKAFRGKGVRSGNLLFSGAKTGQPETDFFAHCLCTQVSEKVSRSLKPIIKKFYDYSENPLSLGVSDFCSYKQDGNITSSASDTEREIQFPYIVLLHPVYNFAKNSTEENEAELDIPFDSFLNDLLSIPNGSTLYNIFACPNPSSVLDATKLQRIGKIVSTSDMITSDPTDGLFFRHQKKEEDYALRPEWKKEVQAQCSSDGGKTKDSISKLAGWKMLEASIQEGKYVDFEKIAVTK